MNLTSFHFHRMSDLICVQAISGTNPPPFVLEQVFRESPRHLGSAMARPPPEPAVSKARLAKACAAANKLPELPLSRAAIEEYKDARAPYQ